MSTYSNLAVENRLTTDALYQAYCQAVEAAFLASGFLEVASDTGQQNNATVTRPGAINTYSGFRMYRAKDSLAATKPLYVKVEYGFASALNRPKIQTTLGTGSNGSGTLTGQVAGPNSQSPTSDGSGTLMVLGGGGEHSVAFYQFDAASSTFTIFFLFGRFLDPTDGSVGDPVLWQSFMSGSSTVLSGSMQWTDGASAWASVSNGFGSFFEDLSQSIHSGGNVNNALLFQGLAYRNAKAWSLPVLAGKQSELPYTNPASSLFSLDVWGSIHTFLPIPSQVVYSNVRLAILWE